MHVTVSYRQASIPGCTTYIRPTEIFFGQNAQTPQGSLGQKVSQLQQNLEPSERERRNGSLLVENACVRLKIDLNSPFDPNSPVEFEQFDQEIFWQA